MKRECTQPEWPIFVSPRVWPWLFLPFLVTFTPMSNIKSRIYWHFHGLILENFIKNNFCYRLHHCSVYLRTCNSLWHLLGNITKAYLWDLLPKVRLLDSSRWTIFSLFHSSVCYLWNVTAWIWIHWPLTGDRIKINAEICFSLNSIQISESQLESLINWTAMLYCIPCFENRNFSLLVL